MIDKRRTQSQTSIPARKSVIQNRFSQRICKNLCLLGYDIIFSIFLTLYILLKLFGPIKKIIKKNGFKVHIR